MAHDQSTYKWVINLLKSTNCLRKRYSGHRELKFGMMVKKFGKGMLNLELILVDKLGFDLSANPYSFK